MAKGNDSSGSESRSSEKDSEKEVSAEARTAETGPAGAPRPMLDLDFVRGLIEAVDGSGIDSLEITRAGTRVKISKTPPSAGPGPTYLSAPQAAAPAAPAAPPAPAPAEGAGEAASESAAPAGGAGGPEPSAAEGDGLVDITSPMVGTFYRAPAPEAPPYVEVGTKVGKGQTLCIIEAMKLMNELESEAEGVIREVLVENAEPVEFGQVLFRIDPAG